MPASGVSASPCTIVDAQSGQASASPLLYASCGGPGLRIGEAASYSVATNATLGTTLVVRQNAGRTEVDLVSIGPDSAARLDELATELVAAMIKGGLGRRSAFAVDLTRFAVDGSAAVAPAGVAAGTALRVDLSGYGRATATPAALAPTG